MDDVETVATALSEHWDEHSSPVDGARAAITAYKAWLKDNGWVIVPREATEAMIEDTWDFVDAEDSNIVAKAWAAMLKKGEMKA